MSTEPGRGWGPFSGRQLTTIICVGMVTVLFPVGAWAVTASSTYVTDAHTHKSAAVNTAGQLAVSGPVTASVASPKNFFNGTARGTGPIPAPVAAPPAGQALIITSVTLDYTKAAPSTQSLALSVSTTDATCGTRAQAIFEETPSATGARVLTFQPGIVVPAGRAFCVEDSDIANIVAKVFVDGYLVAASAAPAGS